VIDEAESRLTARVFSHTVAWREVLHRPAALSHFGPDLPDLPFSRSEHTPHAGAPAFDSNKFSPTNEIQSDSFRRVRLLPLVRLISCFPLSMGVNPSFAGKSGGSVNSAPLNLVLFLLSNNPKSNQFISSLLPYVLSDFFRHSLSTYSTYSV
jgi:hypothetical protein